MPFVVSNDGSTLKKYQPEEDQTSALEVVVPGTFTIIGKEAFYEAYDVHSVIIEEGIKKIGSSAFCACGMNKISLPKSLEEIAYDAFGHCTKLAEVVLPDNLKKLGKSPFTNCACDVIVSENNNLLKTVNRKLFSKDGKKLIFYPTNCKETKYIVPDGTQIIGELAFAWNEHITEIVLPEGVKEIKGGAFGSCETLERIVIPASVRKIDIEFEMETFDAMSSWYPQKRETFIIEAPKGSYAIEFAKEHEIKYVEV